jgi:hypothetical protein
MIQSFYDLGFYKYDLNSGGIEIPKSNLSINKNDENDENDKTIDTIKFVNTIYYNYQYDNKLLLKEIYKQYPYDSFKMGMNKITLFNNIFIPTKIIGHPNIRFEMLTIPIDTSFNIERILKYKYKISGLGSPIYKKTYYETLYRAIHRTSQHLNWESISNSISNPKDKNYLKEKTIEFIASYDYDINSEEIKKSLIEEKIYNLSISLLNNEIKDKQEIINISKEATINIFNDDYKLVLCNLIQNKIILLHENFLKELQLTKKAFKYAYGGEKYTTPIGFGVKEEAEYKPKYFDIIKLCNDIKNSPKDVSYERIENLLKEMELKHIFPYNIRTYDKNEICQKLTSYKERYYEPKGYIKKHKNITDEEKSDDKGKSPMYPKKFSF